MKLEILCAVATLVSSVVEAASFVTIDGYKWPYTVEADGICLGGSDVVQSSWTSATKPRPKGDFVIPSTVDDQPVTSLRSSALANCQDLTSVVIPERVTSIGQSCFEGCISLTNVTCNSRSVKFGVYSLWAGDREIHLKLPSDIESFSANGANRHYSATVCTRVVIDIDNKEGFVMSGWTNQYGVVADPFQGPVLFGPWWRKTVTIEFNANGGNGNMDTQMALEGDDLHISGNSFTRNGYSFLGWAKSVNGDVEYADGAAITKIEASADGTTLYAIWKPHTPTIYPDGNITFSNVSQLVSISCEAKDVTILCTMDGSDPAINGIEYTKPVSIYESCVIRAIARGAGRDSEETAITLTRAEPLSEAVNLYGYLMETDTGNPWTVVTDVSHDGVSCVKSGAIGHGGTTWLQTSVRKAGTVSFWWKAACEEAEEEDGETYWYDYGSFLVDGVVKAQIAGNDTGWQFVSVDVPSGGKHVFRWEYTKDSATSYSPDCIWLDQVQWIPADGSGYTLTTPEPVPYSWLTGYSLGLDSDFETAAKQATGKVDAKGRSMAVWQDYVAGTNPTNPNDFLRAMIAISNGMPCVSWTPNLNTNGEVRVYTVMGKTNLTDAAWMCPTNAAHRFFKVKVEMP